MTAASEPIAARPIKILRIIARLNVGGPALHCLLLSDRLRQEGFETVLVTGAPAPGEASFEELFSERREASNIRIERLPAMRRAPGPWRDLQALFRLIALIRRERPDVVHTHTAKAGVLGRLAAWLCGVPVIVHTFHGHVLHGYFSAPISLLVRLAERLLAHLSSALVTLSPALAEELSGRYRIAPREHFHLVALGRDLEAFYQAPKGRIHEELGLPASIPLIGCIGRLVPIKDHETLLSAFALLPKETAARLLIVGEGELGAALRERAGELGLLGESPRVYFLGWRSDLPEIYGDLRAMVLSSRNEGTPLSMIESFASSCPVVATRVGGVPDMMGEVLAPPGPEQVEARAAGWLVPPGDPKALALALERALGDDEAHSRAASEARKLAAGYSADRLASDIARLYRKLLSEVQK